MQDWGTLAYFYPQKILVSLYSLIANNNMSVRKITLAEVAQHNKADDLWIVVAGKVYDVTKFLSEHPGKQSLPYNTNKWYRRTITPFSL